jgi:hypothetical protein
MNGKGSKPRPLTVSKKSFDDNWERIFGMKKPIQEGQFWSDNGKRSAVVLLTKKGYEVELLERSKHIRTVDVYEHSLNYAEDVAENWCLGVLN